MPLQSVIAFVQSPLPKFGHCAMFHPIAASDGSLLSASMVPQTLSLPPHALTIAVSSFVRAFTIAGWVLSGSVAQTVSRGSTPFTFASSQRCSAAASWRMNTAAAVTIAALHFVAGFVAASACGREPTSADTSERNVTRLGRNR